MARQGPHQGAHTSTSKGKVVRATCRSNIVPYTFSGDAANSLRLHLPHFASNGERASGRRLVLPQWQQTIMVSLMMVLPFGNGANRLI
jgi:hypothetical protein